MASSSADDLRTAMRDTLRSLLEDYDIAVEKKDTSYLSARLTPDCTRHLAPANYPATCSFVKAVETNSSYEERMKTEFAVLEATRTKIFSLVVDPVELKGSAHAEHWTKARGYEGVALEICWFVDFAPGGRAISRIVQFIDTAAAAKMVEAYTNP